MPRNNSRERHAYLVTYDVSDKRRLRKTHRLMLGYGDPVQYSVFRCELSPREVEILVTRLDEVIAKGSDRVLIVDMGPARSKRDRIRMIGKPLEPLDDDGPVIF
jgi:CRISPR-associated protein Cas2